MSSTDLRRRLDDLTLTDAQRIGRRLSGVRRKGDPAAQDAKLAAIAADLERAEARIARRRAALPLITYPPELPVSERRDDIAAAVRDHQVVVLAGETGSGKTTQLPKICLELGRGIRGLIGHTQPRRIAARTVAERLADELDVTLGAAVGYAVRFTDQVGDDTLVKVMTDGILLAEIQRDRDLRRYDTIIIDEAHERSLTIDFLLGYLTRLLPRRPELKVIITSATIDPDRFARHFGGAPVVEVSGRTYPVEVRYRPLVEIDAEDSRRPRAVAASPEGRDQTEAVCEAVMELEDEGSGDVLVFLSGEREIRDTADALNDLSLRDTEIVPLYARLSIAEQHRVFEPHRGRRVVLATNVAETSLTVPGVRYVVDAGTARISRYSARTKVQRLPIEPISQASAHQRAGRCGRVADGICIRLYSEDDYESRPAFTEPEIQRTSLAAVILQMAALGLGDIEAFPFVDPPDRRQVRDGLALLEELGALETSARDSTPRLTPIGRRLAQLPLDPRLGRMVLAAEENGCVREVVVIAAAMSIQDPRERPLDRQQAADEQHRRFAADGSDFLAYLNLWAYLREQQKSLSSSAFRRMCRREFLHYLRIREWQDVVAQLKQALASIGIPVTSAPSESDRIHQSLLAGLLSHIGLKDASRGDYLGARGARFAINPGSTLFKVRPDWVMAGELVETTRLWARVCARIDPAWAEQLAEHLVVRTYGEPRWSGKRGSAVADERVTLFGVPLVAARTVPYARVDPGHARELFLRHALVEGDWRTHHAFWETNQDLLAEVEELEHRARRRGIVADDDVLFDFYDARVPASVVSVRHFDAWWKKARPIDPSQLTFTRELLLGEDAKADELTDEAAFPDVWHVGDVDLPVAYRFDPGAPDDGVTVHVPLSVLNQVADAGFDWQVPGMREELATALVRSLPKALRRNFVPAPDRAREALARMGSARRGPFTAALGRALTGMTGVVVPLNAWDVDRVPAYLRPTFAIEDDAGKVVATGKDLAALRAALGVEIRRVVARIGSELERDRLRSWEIGTLPRVIEASVGDQVVRGFPALVDRGDSVAVRVLGSEVEQATAMRAGLRRLLLFGAPSPARLAAAALDTRAKLAIAHNPHGSVARLLDDCVACAVDALVADGGGVVWDKPSYDSLREMVLARLRETAIGVIRTTAEILALAHEVELRLSSLNAPQVADSVADARAQLSGLVYQGFVTATGVDRMRHLPRYLRALQYRLDALPNDPPRDFLAMQRVHSVADEYAKVRARAADDPAASAVLIDVRWMLEEFRVSVFAQRLGTPQPVSEKRILRALATV